MYNTARIGIEVSTDDGALCDRPETSELLVPEVCVLVTCSVQFSSHSHLCRTKASLSRLRRKAGSHSESNIFNVHSLCLTCVAGPIPVSVCSVNTCKGHLRVDRFVDVWAQSLFTVTVDLHVIARNVCRLPLR